ncbi:MAG: alpha-amylase [Solobacterium sp.]|nr:alpha-amylase [Solobacterium sp.]
MAWFEEAVFYHIYPLGLLGAPEHNDHGEPVHRLRELHPWITHIRELGCNALYIGPLFSSGTHGYDTSDYRKVDERLGDNEDLSAFVRECHEQGIRVILDAVFNHTGREFFAFQDILQYRENSRYRNWYRIDFSRNNSYNDGLRYENWGGHDLLVKLNMHEPEVRNYLLDVVREWVNVYDIDGLRLDAADVLDFGFMQELRRTADEVKPEFWLMGEVIHGEYTRWVNDHTLHAVTDYALHKALYSGHNDHNYFEIAHTVRRTLQSGMRHLYNFADNHDTERIMTRLHEKANWYPLHILLYTLPGIPSLYYGSEYGIEGRKERYSDASLRPRIDLAQMQENDCLRFLQALGTIRRKETALVYGDYEELHLTTGQFAFRRGDIIITVNNEEHPADIPAKAGNGTYTGAISGRECMARDGHMQVHLEGNSGEIWIPEGRTYTPVKITPPKTAEKKPAPEPQRYTGPAKSYEEMTVEELQAEILAKMAKNGPVNEQMKKSVLDNIWHDSLVNWVKSFR